MSAFAAWEPGYVSECFACGAKRGGDDPPGPWFRHRPSHRRRLPIWGPNRLTLGWFTYVHP